MLVDYTIMSASCNLASESKFQLMITPLQRGACWNLKGNNVIPPNFVSEEIWQLMFLAACRKCLWGACRVNSGGQRSRWVHIRPCLLDQRMQKTLDINLFLHQSIWSMTGRSCKTARSCSMSLVPGESICTLQISLLRMCLVAAYNLIEGWEPEVFASLSLYTSTGITVNSPWGCLFKFSLTDLKCMQTNTHLILNRLKNFSLRGSAYW